MLRRCFNRYEIAESVYPWATGWTAEESGLDFLQG
jgi:hypothetical protein